MNITRAHTPNFHVGRTEPVAAIVIHVTEGDAGSVLDWFARAESQVSAHYLVCADGRVVQFVDEVDQAFAQGRVDRPTARVVRERPGINPNQYCIAIEHEGDGQHDLTELQRATSLRLIRDIATRHQLPIDRDHVVGHHEIFAQKRCPGAIDVDRLVREAAVMTV